MRAHVRKWGNSASVRIPASVMASADLGIDQAIDIREEGGRIVIEPVRGPVHDLDRLLDRMTPETYPDEVDFEPPMGQESW
ncbi:MAG TPA: AbrB/MazE/SpoVT family DNA-binding domain-containing protein [Caulobacteraceae bacterium]|nr:AbrB/MazE/SpoVT family DNA-binding domain-containing protein [Caulobacteraceae bacterium]